MSCFHTRSHLFRVVFDIIIIALVVSGILAIQKGAKPYHRGFFCDDESIQYPFVSDTVPIQLAVLVGVLLPLVVILILEFSLRNTSRANILSIRKTDAESRSWIAAAYNTLAVFIFGMTVTQFLTEIAKFSVGRLRPHFLTLCNPDFSKFNCSDGYITADVCTYTESFTTKDSRLSFPSGHSSFSMYCMLYLILYLQARIVCRGAALLKPFIQLLLFSASFFTCLSRISDYKHHWSDVLAGAILGVVICVFVVVSLTDFGQFLCRRGSVCRTGVESRVSSTSQSVEEGFAETQYYGSTAHSNLDSQERQRLLQPGKPK